MNYTLGLDIGVGSVGWAVLCNDVQGEPYKIADLGVRVFDAAENPKTGASLAAPRREARSARRRLRRKRHRKERIRNLLIQSGVITQERMEALFLQSGFAKDVYTLRAEGLDRRLEPEEWVRVLLHLAQRRGYRSNSTAEAAKEKETGVLKTAISANEQLMKEKQYRTVGEMFCKDKKFQWVAPDGTIWRKTHNEEGNYQFTITRELVEQEVAALFAAQRALGNPFASETLEEPYGAILFSQRPFDEGPGRDSPFRRGDLRGTCTFEPGELRAFKACYTFEYFKLLQDLNHIRLLFPEEPSRQLTQQERQILIDLAMKSAELHYGRLRKALQLPENAAFNMVPYGDGTVEAAEKKRKFPQMQSYHQMRKALDSVEKDYIRRLTTEQLDGIGTILSLYKADDRRREQLAAMGLEEQAIAALLPLSFSKAGNLSLCAMQKLIPHLEQGVNYDVACAAVYGDHRAHGAAQRRHTITLNPAFWAESGMDDIRNPVVLRAISQTTKVLNAVIRKYGSPQRICIELARELKKPFQEREKQRKDNEKRQKQNESVMEKIAEIKGSRPTGQDLLKCRLYEEQNGVCLYSGQQLDAARLYEPGYVDIDHIIPYSKCFDDSYRNKVLVRASENRQKGNRTPLEYLSGDPERVERYVTLVETTIRDYRKQQRLLKRSWTAEDEKEFKVRNLSDTQYITRTVYNLLKDHLEFAPLEGRKKQVVAVNGAITDYLRKRLGLTKVREDGDLHHAMDAVVVAVTTDGMIQKITRYTQRRENDCNPMGTYTDPATGEVLSRDEYDQKYGKQFPEPWPGFRQELLARLSPNPDKEVRALRLPNYDSDEKIRPVFVSRMPRRKVTGAAHEATIRSPRPEQRVVTKTPLQKLKLDKDGEIADYYNWQDDILLYEAVKARLTAYKGDGEKAFQEDFYKPKRDGSKGPLVKKVKTYAKSSSNVVTCGGVAKNGDMIRIDVYHVPEDGYYLIPIYTADVVRGVLPQKAVVAHVAPSDWKEMQEIHFIFSLYPGDLIGISAKKEINLKRRNADGTGEPELKRKEWMLYYTSANIAIGAITVTTHDRKYEKSSLGIKTLLTIEKYEVDPLGNYHKVKVPEKRQTF